MYCTVHGSAGRQPLGVGKQLVSVGSCVGDTHVPVVGRGAMPEEVTVLSTAEGDGPGERSSDSSRRRRAAASSVTGDWREAGCAVERVSKRVGVLEVGGGVDGALLVLVAGDW